MKFPCINKNMKNRKLTILILVLLHFPFSGKSQKSYDPIYYSVGKLEVMNLMPDVGKKFIFNQTCTHLIPTMITDDFVFFENFYFGSLQIKTSFSIEDTILKNLTYEIKGNKNDALKFLKLDTISFQHLQKDTFHYVEKQEGTLIDCWILKNKIIYSKSAISLEKN